MKLKNTLPLAAVLLLTATACSKKKDAAGDNADPQGASGYPLTTCVVSGEELGSMGKPVDYDHEGTSVRFCCKACIKDFKADPEKYLAKLEK